MNIGPDLMAILLLPRGMANYKGPGQPSTVTEGVVGTSEGVFFYLLEHEIRHSSSLAQSIYL